MPMRSFIGGSGIECSVVGGRRDFPVARRGVADFNDFGVGEGFEQTCDGGIAPGFFDTPLTLGAADFAARRFAGLTADGDDPALASPFGELAAQFASKTLGS